MMATQQPEATLASQFSSSGATATPWSEAERLIDGAEVYWLSTVRPDGRPHVTPLIAVWLDGVLFFSTGATERKAMNLESNTHCVLTTGCNVMNEGLDLVVEGDAVRVSNESTLQRAADLFKSKYGWDFTVSHGAFVGDAGNVAQVYEVKPNTVFGFGKGDTFSQTRWQF
jgi:hypothetical protein